MTTLKELLDQTVKADRWGDIYSDTDEIVKTVKEWLTQKRREQEQIFDTFGIAEKDFYKMGKQSGRFNQIDELLGELEK